MQIIDLDSPIEKIMEKALKENAIDYDSQYAVYEKNGSKRWFHKYIFDFVVYGKHSKVVVECDGKAYHSTDEQRVHDTTRDIWALHQGFDDVLRFTGSQIKKDVRLCIDKIKSTIQSYDELYKKRKDKAIFHTNEVTAVPDKDTVATIIHELLPPFIRATHIETKNFANVIYRDKAILRGYRNVLTRNFYNLTEQNLFFSFPNLRKLVENRHISLFFCGYNIPIALILSTEPRKMIYIDEYLSQESRILKLIITIKAADKIVNELVSSSIKSFVFVDMFKGKIVESDLYNQEFNYKLPIYEQKQNKQEIKRKRKRKRKKTIQGISKFNAIEDLSLAPCNHLRKLQNDAQKMERELRRNYYIWFSQTVGNSTELEKKIQSQESKLKTLYRDIYTHPALVKSKPKLFADLDKKSTHTLTKELNRYWSQKQKEGADNVVFNQATSWIKTEGYRFKLIPFTLHDIVMYFQELKSLAKVGLGKKTTSLEEVGIGYKGKNS